MFALRRGHVPCSMIRCVDRITMGAGLPDHDADGKYRPMGKGWDIGADEVKQ